MTRSVAVDDEVYALLVTRTRALGQTANDVLRVLLMDRSGWSPTPTLPSRAAGVGDLKPLLTVGLVAAGDELVYEQRRKRLVHRATVTADGCVVADGQVFQKVSPALRSLVGHEASGWSCWTHARSGRLLMDLRGDLRGDPPRHPATVCAARSPSAGKRDPA